MLTRSPKPPKSSYIVLGLVSVVWGSAWIANQVLAEETSPIQAGALTYSIAFAPLVLVLTATWFRPRLKLRLPDNGGPASTSIPRTFAGLAAQESTERSIKGIRARVGLVLGLTMFAGPYILIVWAARHGAGGWAPLIYASLPLALCIRAGSVRIPAILGLGAMFALLNGSLPLTAEKLLWTAPIVLAVALQGWSILYARANLVAASSIACMMTQFGCAGCLLIAASLTLGDKPGATTSHLLSGSAILAAILLGVLADAAAYLFYFRLLRTLEPAQIATTQWLQTIVATGEAAWLLRRNPGWTLLAAAGALVVCTWLLLRPEHPKPGPLALH